MKAPNKTKRKAARGKASSFPPHPSRRRKEIAEQLWKARIDTLGHVIATFRHETRNLLGALGTCVQILRKNPRLAREDAELLDIIQSGSRRLNDIISEFSAFRPHRPPHFQEVCLQEVIDETFAKLRRDDRYRSSAVTFRRDLDPLVPAIKADREQLEQALRNLLLNAVQAMGDQGQLTVETKSAGKKVKITVRDTGSGIPAKILPDIFDPFYSTKAGSLGLGLAAARYIVARHGGRIDVRSDSGGGTCFTMLLPIEQRAMSNQEYPGR